MLAARGDPSPFRPRGGSNDRTVFSFRGRRPAVRSQARVPESRWVPLARCGGAGPAFGLRRRLRLEQPTVVAGRPGAAGDLSGSVLDDGRLNGAEPSRRCRRKARSPIPGRRSSCGGANCPPRTSAAELPGLHRPAANPADITLNFSGADIRDVVAEVLGQILKINYVIDPDVTGVVTFNVSRPMRRDEVLPVSKPC